MGIIDTTDVQHYLSFLRMAGCKPWHVNGVDSMGFTLHDPMIRTIAEFIQQCLDDGVLKAEPLWDSRYALPQDGVYATIVYANWFGKILAS
jgi:LacI family transcriptional regulator